MNFFFKLIFTLDEADAKKMTLMLLDNPFIYEFNLEKGESISSHRHEFDNKGLPLYAKLILTDILVAQSQADAFTMTLGPAEEFADCLIDKFAMKLACRNNLNKVYLFPMYYGNY